MIDAKRLNLNLFTLCVASWSLAVILAFLLLILYLQIFPFYLINNAILKEVAFGAGSVLMPVTSGLIISSFFLDSASKAGLKAYPSLFRKPMLENMGTGFIGFCVALLLMSFIDNYFELGVLTIIIPTMVSFFAQAIYLKVGSSSLGQ
jgi:hypothetical protein